MAREETGLERTPIGMWTAEKVKVAAAALAGAVPAAKAAERTKRALARAQIALVKAIPPIAVPRAPTEMAGLAAAREEGALVAKPTRMPKHLVTWR